MDVSLHGRGTASRNWHNPYGNNKYLWGNVFAIDVLQLKQNEGHHYHQCLALLFAGKIRSLTFLDLRLTLAWYDREFEVVARTRFCSSWHLKTENVRAAADTSQMWDIAESLIHLWYSAFISTDVLSRLHTQVKPLIENVCNRTAEKAANVILGKTWRFTSGNTLRLVLRKVARSVKLSWGPLIVRVSTLVV